MGRLGPPWHYEHWGTQSASADVADEVQPRIFKHQKNSEHINIYKHQSFRVFNQNFQPFSFKHQSILKPSGCSSPASASAALSHRFLPGVSNGRYQLRFRHFKFRQFVDSSMWAVPSLFASKNRFLGRKHMEFPHDINWTSGPLGREEPVVFFGPRDSELIFTSICHGCDSSPWVPWWLPGRDWDTHGAFMAIKIG
jgi:hypothetical protein